MLELYYSTVCELCDPVTGKTDETLDTPSADDDDILVESLTPFEDKIGK